MAIYEQSLLNVIQHLVLEVFRHFGFEQFETESMNSADVHLSQAADVTKGLVATFMDAFLQFCGSFFRECEGDDVSWNAASAAFLDWAKQRDNSLGYHFSFARTCARN